MDFLNHRQDTRVPNRNRPKAYGIYRGIVTNNQDPEGMGRIKARVSLNVNEETTWAMPCLPSPFHQFIPNVGDLVWIMFEGGNIDQPVYMGYWWPIGKIPDPDVSQRYIYNKDGTILRVVPGQFEIESNLLVTNNVTVNKDIIAKNSIIVGQGSKPVARVGDKVKVNIGGVDYEGEIISGSEVLKSD